MSHASEWVWLGYNYLYAVEPLPWPSLSPASSLLLLLPVRTRKAGLAGLQGVTIKVSQASGQQLNIWDADHMDKIVPAFLFNMEALGR